MAIDNPVDVYLREVAAIPPLTLTAETELIVRIRQGGCDAETAKKDLLEANLSQVVSIAQEFSQDPGRLIELILEGNIGLMRAADDMDYLSDVRFSTHAYRYIRQAIADVPPAK